MPYINYSNVVKITIMGDLNNAYYSKIPRTHINMLTFCLLLLFDRPIDVEEKNHLLYYSRLLLSKVKVIHSPSTLLNSTNILQRFQVKKEEFLNPKLFHLQKIF